VARVPGGCGRGRPPEIRGFLDAATHTAEVFERAQVEDHVVDNENRPATEVAAEVLHRVGWL
jgi:hypothetical protein